MITVTTEGRKWDDPTAPWEATTHTFDRPNYWNAMDAVRAVASADFYENLRLVAWAASTEAEREEMRRMLAARPYLAYVLDLESNTTTRVKGQAMSYDDDRDLWSDIDHEIYQDAIASLTPWQFVAYLARIDRDAAQEYAAAAPGCATVEVDGQQVTVDRGRRPILTVDGVHVPVPGPAEFVFIPAPHTGAAAR